MTHLENILDNSTYYSVMPNNKEKHFLKSSFLTNIRKFQKVKPSRKKFLFAAVFVFGIAIFAQFKINSAFEKTSSIQAADDSQLAMSTPADNSSGPIRIGLQVGHWKNKELPDELANLRDYGGGSNGGGKAEWEVNLAIAKDTAKILEDKGYAVDILPATVPPGYQADVFIAIHADGNTDPSVSGFKVSPPWHDQTGKSDLFAQDLEKTYGEVTNLKVDPNISNNMQGYYAFNYRRYEHSISPDTPAVIIETGFLTDPSDRKLIVNHPEKAADGIAQAVEIYFKNA